MLYVAGVPRGTVILDGEADNVNAAPTSRLKVSAFEEPSIAETMK